MNTLYELPRHFLSGFLGSLTLALTPSTSRQPLLYTYVARQYFRKMSKVVSVLVGTILSLVAAYILAQYFTFVPDFDIWVVSLIILLNLLQCLPNQASPSSKSLT